MFNVLLRSTRFLGSAHFFSLVPPEECSPCGHWAVGPSGDGPKCLFDKFVWITLVKVRGGKTAFSLRSNYKFCTFGRSLNVFFFLLGLHGEFFPHYCTGWLRLVGQRIWEVFWQGSTKNVEFLWCNVDIKHFKTARGSGFTMKLQQSESWCFELSYQVHF